MDWLLPLLGMAVLANFVTWWFIPLQNFKDKYCDSKCFMWLDSTFMNCPKCFALWTSLLYAILTGQHIIFFPLVAAMVAHIIGIEYGEENV